MNKAKFDKRITVAITENMHILLEELARKQSRKGKPSTVADIVREAIRWYLEQEGDVTGSRKQIAKSLEGRMDMLSEQVKMLTMQNEQLIQHLSVEWDFMTKQAEALQPLIKLAKARTQKPGG